MRRFAFRLVLAIAFFAAAFCNAAVITIGNESLNSKDMPMRLQKCNAYATYNETTGFTLTFSGSSVVPGGISSSSSGGDLKIVLEKGAILDIVQDEYGNNNGIFSSYNLVITGLGTINIVNCKSSNAAVYGSSSVKLVGTAVNITHERETASASAIATYMSGPITIDASFVTAVGYGTLIRGGNVTMTGSMLNLLQKASDQNSSDAVIEAWWNDNELSIVGCVVTMIAADKDSRGFACLKKILVGDSCIVAVTKKQCFFAWEKVSFLDSRVLAISEDFWGVGTYDADSNIQTYTPARSINGVNTGVFFGNGKYVLSSGKEKNTVLSGKVEIDGGDVELCSPAAIGVECYDFNMKDGDLQMVNDVSFKNCYEEILAKATVEAVVASSGVFGDWMGLHTTMLASMVGELAATLAENPSGKAEMAISCDNYVQSGGTIGQGESTIGCRITRLGSYARGVYNERIDATAIPAIVGGVYDGTFETFGYEDDGSWNGVWHDHYDICPTNRIGQILTHVSYSPYWIFTGGSGEDPDPQPYEPSEQTIRVSFDPDEGNVDVTSYTYTIGSAYGWFPTPTRDGYAFLGWSQYRDGYVRKSTSDIVSADVLTLYAVWAKGQDLKFCVPDDISASFFLVAKDVPNAKPNVLTVGDIPILRCYIANAGVYSVKGFKVAFKFQGKTYYNKKWVDREIGAGDWSYLYETEDFLRGLDAGTYSLTCIIDSENSVQEVDEGNNEQTIEFCVMSLSPVEVRFDPTGGSVAEPIRTVDGGGAIGVLPVPERQGYEFAGWFTAEVGGTQVMSTTLVTKDITYYARWRWIGGLPTVVDEADTHVDVAKGEVVPFETAAAVYDGFLYKGGKVVGSVQVKVAKGKVDKKSGKFSAKVTVTVQLTGEAKKLSFKGGFADEKGQITEMTDKNGHKLAVTVGVKGLGGTLDGKYKIDGARNVFSGKSSEDKSAAAEALRLYQGVYNVASDCGTLSITVDKKGKAKIAGTVEGNKVSATGQLAVGAGAAVVPVVIVKKINLVFNLWVTKDGTVEVCGVNSGTSGETPLPLWIAGRPVALGSGAKFGVDAEEVKKLLSGLFAEYLPNGVAVSQSGKKWSVADGAKAGKLVLDKTTGGLDLQKSKITANTAGLKLGYKEKNGTFTGSFKAYNFENGKIKAYTANVTGVMIGTKGYGTATIKKFGSMAVTIE